MSATLIGLAPRVTVHPSGRGRFRADYVDGRSRWVAYSYTAPSAALAAWDMRTADHTAAAANGGLSGLARRLNARLGTDTGRCAATETHLVYTAQTRHGRTMNLHLNPPNDANLR